jgi:hypothetical protein
MHPVATQELATADGAPQKLIRVEYNGKLIGYFLPAPPGWDPNDKATRHAFERLGEAVERAQKESGLDEEGLVLALTNAGA